MAVHDAEVVGRPPGGALGENEETSARGLSPFAEIEQFQVEHGGHVFRIPAFYFDLLHFDASFLAPLEQLRGLLPSSRLFPVRATPRHGIFSIGVFEYRESDIGPYNEVSLAIPVTLGRAAPVFVGLVDALRRGVTVYVWQLPVTTEIARYGGVELYGFPKFLADITISQNREWARCRLAEGGRDIFEMSVRRLPARPASRAVNHALTLRNGRILRSELILELRNLGTTRSSDAVRLELGDHPLGRRLAGLGLGRPVQVEYCPSARAVLTPPLESCRA